MGYVVSGYFCSKFPHYSSRVGPTFSGLAVGRVTLIWVTRKVSAALNTRLIGPD